MVMKKQIAALFIAFSILGACKKNNDTTPVKQQDLWPLTNGNSWTYKVTNYTADGASIDGGTQTISIEGTKSFNGKTYFGISGMNLYCENEGNTLYETDSTGSYFRILAKSLEQTDTLFKQAATYNVNGTDYNGTLARVASAYGTVIDQYTCVQITDIYTDANGKLGKKVVVYYSPGTGPVSFLYYSNPEHPNSDSVYRTQGLVLDNASLQ